MNKRKDELSIAQYKIELKKETMFAAFVNFVNEAYI